MGAEPQFGQVRVGQEACASSPREGLLAAGQGSAFAEAELSPVRGSAERLSRSGSV